IRGCPVAVNSRQPALTVAVTGGRSPAPVEWGNVAFERTGTRSPAQDDPLGGRRPRRRGAGDDRGFDGHRPDSETRQEDTRRPSTRNLRFESRTLPTRHL